MSTIVQINYHHPASFKISEITFLFPLESYNDRKLARRTRIRQTRSSKKCKGVEEKSFSSLRLFLIFFHITTSDTRFIELKTLRKLISFPSASLYLFSVSVSFAAARQWFEKFQILNWHVRTFLGFRPVFLGSEKLSYIVKTSTRRERTF